MMDNASNNDTLMEALESKCHEAGVEFSASDSQMRCIPHTIHLTAIKASLPCLFYSLSSWITFRFSKVLA